MLEGTILLVEDNSSDEELTLRALKKTNFVSHIVVVRDGSEALDYLFGKGSYAERDLRKMPQIIFLDLNLPKIGGIEVLKKIRDDERTKLLPVVVLTSSKQEKDILEVYRLGANSYVVKPVDFTQFAMVVQELGSYWLLRNQWLT